MKEPTAVKPVEEPAQEATSMWGGAWSALTSLIPFGGAAVPDDEETPGGPDEEQKDQEEVTPGNGQQDSASASLESYYDEEQDDADKIASAPEPAQDDQKEVDLKAAKLDQITAPKADAKKAHISSESSCSVYSMGVRSDIIAQPEVRTSTGKKSGSPNKLTMIKPAILSAKKPLGLQNRKKLNEPTSGSKINK